MTPTLPKLVGDRLYLPSTPAQETALAHAPVFHLGLWHKQALAGSRRIFLISIGVGFTAHGVDHRLSTGFRYVQDYYGIAAPDLAKRLHGLTAVAFVDFSRVNGEPCSVFRLTPDAAQAVAATKIGSPQLLSYLEKRVCEFEDSQPREDTRRTGKTWNSHDRRLHGLVTEKLRSVLSDRQYHEVQADRTLPGLVKAALEAACDEFAAPWVSALEDAVQRPQGTPWTLADVMALSMGDSPVLASVLSMADAADRGIITQEAMWYGGVRGMPMPERHASHV